MASKRASMKRVAIKEFISYRKSNIIGGEQAVMFHGEAIRSGLRSIHAKNATWSNSVRTPLHIIHSKQVIPDVFKPAHNLVVSERVKQRLIDVNHVEFVEVVFDKLVDFYYEKGSFTYFDSKDSFTELGEIIPAIDYLISLPDDREAHRGLGKYYELVIPDDEEMVNGLVHTAVSIDIEPPSWQGDPLVIRYNKEVFEQNPIIKVQSSIAFELEVFSRIREYIDMDYFHIKEFEL
jgi:hypothetical protein